MTIDETMTVLQAAKEGKKIQREYYGERWEDFDLRKLLGGLELRVVPEQRECWRNQFVDGSLSEVCWDTLEAAKHRDAHYSREWKPIRFREVLEGEE
jgi:hypothetical protein